MRRGPTTIRSQGQDTYGRKVRLEETTQKTKLLASEFGAQPHARTNHLWPKLSKKIANKTGQNERVR